MYGKSWVNKMEHLYHLHCVYSPQEFVETPLFGIPEEQVLGLPSNASLLIILLLLSPRQQRWWKERFILLVKQSAREALKGDQKIAEQEGTRYLPSPTTPTVDKKSCSEHPPEEFTL